MKVSQGHYDALNKAITQVIEQYGEKQLVDQYEQGRFARADKVKDLQTRFCFDLLHGANVPELINELYDVGCNDTHILTALKRICPVVQRKRKGR